MRVYFLKLMWVAGFLLGCDAGEPPNKAQPPITSHLSVDFPDTSLQKDRSLLKRYRGEADVPDALYRTYLELTVAFGKRDREAISKLCLPSAVEIMYGSRPEEARWTGQEVNLHFAQEYFMPEIQGARWEDEDTVLLSTGTTALWFVHTKRDVWRLYKYVDRPIQ